MRKTTIILALESSCDETAGAILDSERQILGEFVASQLDLHRQFGGVVPEVACRAHLQCLLPGLQKMLADSQVSPAQLDAIAVTCRPGLIGALLVGLTAAKSLAYAWDKPLIGVDHIQAHIAAAGLHEPELQPPYVALVVSGGHTNLYHVPRTGVYEVIGRTLDDAAGEAFDKAAKLLDLGFPGGPAISAAAENGDWQARPWRNTCLPQKHPHDWSFSGLKTAVLYAARGQRAGRHGPLLLNEQQVADVAASFQYAVVRALTRRALAAVKRLNAKWLAVGGGVSANKLLRQTLQEQTAKHGCRLALPPFKLCTDNAVMIAARAHEMLPAGEFATLELDAGVSGYTHHT